MVAAGDALSSDGRTLARRASRTRLQSVQKGQLMNFFQTDRLRLPSPDRALRGRSDPMQIPERHFVTGVPLAPPYPGGLELVSFGMGCFWGAEQLFWALPGVHVTAVGYAGGYTPNPNYREACSGQTGHAEVVQVVYEPKVVSFDDLVRVFWENHDPTQGMRQGADVGTQYRSTIYVTTDEQRAAAEASRETYQQVLNDAGYGTITTEIAAGKPFFFAEDYHQQYLAKNPDGYCGIGGTGVACPVGLVTTSATEGT
jgi:peptide-methionine (S)-S-oxide reductase